MARAKKIHPHVGRFYAIGLNSVADEEFRENDLAALNFQVEQALENGYFDDGDIYYVMQVVGVKRVSQEIKVSDAEYAGQAE